MDLKFKTHMTNASWHFLKMINDLKLGRTFHLLWNIYPTMAFIERNNHVGLRK